MAGGWTRDGGVQDQIDATISEAVDRARASLPTGESSKRCDECGTVIPEARRRAVHGVRLCVDCQSGVEGPRVVPGYNRRGSKDSQLR